MRRPEPLLPASPAPGPTIWTVGHSTRTAAELIDLLAAHGIEVVADVRRFPGSRRHPQFGRERLAVALRAAGIDYRHLGDLGGRRPVRPDSPNTAWREPGFRGYADHMETPAWRAAIAALQELARGRRTAILCAEAVWWR